MKILKIVGSADCSTSPIQPALAGVNARIAARLFLQLLLSVMMAVLPAFAQQVVTYPAPEGGPTYVQGSFTESITYSNCVNVIPIPDNTSISSNASELWLLPLHIQANITGDYVAVQL